MAAPPAAIIAPLDDAIQSLAQELQDMIFEFTYPSIQLNTGVRITSDGDTVVRIQEESLPPQLYNINSRTRATSAKRYYTAQNFEISHIWFPNSLSTGGLADLSKWLLKIPAEHRAFIDCIRVWFRTKIRPRLGSAGMKESWERLCNVERHLNDKNIRLQKNVIKTLKTVRANDGSGAKQEWMGVDDLWERIE